MKTLKYIMKTSAQKIFNVKFATFCAAFLILSWTYDQPYLQFVKEKNYPISWCIFPFYMSSFGILSIFYVGIVYIHSDVPFMQHINMYQVIRTGRERWALSQIAGILIRSFFAVILSAIAAVLPFWGHIEFSTDWGKVIKTLASQRADAGFGFGMGQMLDFRFHYGILGKFTPVQLMIITVLICTLICTFLGILMFLISLYAGKILAVAVTMMSVVALFIVENIYGEWKLIVAHVVPTYWAEVALSATPVSGRYRIPSLTYIFTFLIVAVVFMSVIIFCKVKHTEFHWENEDA